jgi:hypothetical protein
MLNFYDKLKVVSKGNPAITTDGVRTIYGNYYDDDAAVLAEYYPRVGQQTIEEIASHINHPRLLEVAGLVEVIERYLESSFSKIRDVAINVVSNPLSILFWSPRGEVHRVKTHESELLHGAMEKMALRRGSLDQINGLIDRKYGLAVTYGCSCCAIAVASDDLASLYSSDYYRRREGHGRFFDSDVLTASDTLFAGVSVADIPQEVFDASADFGQPEVTSYLRFAQACEKVIAENRVVQDYTDAIVDVRAFLTGEFAETRAAK